MFSKPRTAHAAQHRSGKDVWFNAAIAVCNIIEGSLEVKLPTIWRDEKQSREEA